MPRTSRRSPLTIGLALIAAVAATSALAFQLRPTVAPVAGARRLLELPGSAPHYAWLSDGEILLLKADGAAKPGFVRRSVDDDTETPLDSLTALFQQTDGTPETIRVSPDGTYLLWSSRDKTRTIVSPLDAAKHAVVKHDVPTFSLWESDGKRWIAVEMRGGRLGITRTYPRDNPGKPERIVPLSAPLSADQNEVNLNRAAITAAGQFLVQIWGGPDRKFEKANLTLAGFGANAMLTRPLQLTAPHPNEGGEVFFRVDKNLVGWTLRYLPPLQQVTDLGKRPLKTYQTGFWVTNQRTRKTQALGYVESVRDDPNSGPYNAQISPGGKYLSYVYQNGLFLLPLAPE